jgi:hypothetical protein
MDLLFVCSTFLVPQCPSENEVYSLARLNLTPHHVNPAITKDSSHIRAASFNIIPTLAMSQPKGHCLDLVAPFHET